MVTQDVKQFLDNVRACNNDTTLNVKASTCLLKLTFNVHEKKPIHRRIYYTLSIADNDNSFIELREYAWFGSTFLHDVIVEAKQVIKDYGLLV